MKVTNLIQMIGKARDLLEEKDEKKILKNIYIFEQIYNSVQTQLKSYMKNKDHELDFTPADLEELSVEIEKYLIPFPYRLTTRAYRKRINKDYEKLDQKALSDFNQRSVDTMYLDRKLRECQKILAYFAITHELWEKYYEQNKELDFGEDIAKTIRSFI